jgi:predicted phage-related endonuclease
MAMMNQVLRANPLQYGRDWHMARRGKLTSSRMRAVVHGGPKAWTTLIGKLEAELASDEPIEPDLDYVESIAHGRRYEPIARTEAELQLGVEFDLVGFVQHPELKYMGCSSDALWRSQRINVEIKVFVALQKHLQVYQTHQMPDEHRAQVQCQMCVHGYDSTLFVSYHPDAPHWKMRTVIVEVPVNPAYRDLMLQRCDQFIAAMRGHAPITTRSIDIPQLF